MAWNRPLSALLLIMVLTLLALSSARHPQVAVAAPGDISTYAGGGAGDGGGAAGAAVSPQGVAADGAGNLYIADSLNCRVRKLTPGGVISTVAGMGICEYAGDGGPATSARLSFPQSVAVSATGVLYIADTANCRIRRVDAVGIITTFAGTGLCIFGGDGGPPTSAQLAEPRGVAVSSSGDVFIADSDNCRIRKVAGGVITTFAGTGACGFLGDGGPATSAGISHASGVWDDGAGNVYIADTDTCRVRVVTPGGTISTVAGNGTCGYATDGVTAYATSINKPRSVTTDAVGDVYIADTMNCRIRKVSYPSVVISTIAGDGDCNFGGDGGPATGAKLDRPFGVAVSGAVLHIGDTDNCRARRVSGGVITSTAGTGWCQFGGDGGTATNAAISNPGEVAVDSGGNLYIADTSNCRIRKVKPGGTITTFAGNGVCAPGSEGVPATSTSLDSPRGIAVDYLGDVYVAESGACRIRKIDGGIITTFAGTGACGYSGDSGPATNAQLSFPQGVAAGVDVIYIADTFNCRVRRVVAGTITTLAGTGTCTFGGDGDLATAARLMFPYAVAADQLGAVYIADTENCRVRKVAGNTISTIAGTGSCAHGGDGGPAALAALNRPTGIATSSGGAVYIADSDNCSARLISGETIISLAGTVCGYLGDGGPATSAQLDRPAGIATDAAGNAYISDGFNDRIRRVAGGHDADADGVADAADNCPAVANGAQANADRNFIDLPSPISFDDLTRPRSDQAGDACDTDDDNDGLLDSAEAAGCNGGGALNPVLADTDGDRVLDNAECLLGSNPASAASVPPAIVQPDADNDGVPNAFDPNDAAVDSDGDTALDRWEFRHYNTSLTEANADTDACQDSREIASVNPDQVVNSLDLGLVASRLGLASNPNYVTALDITKDGAINSIDLGYIASRFGFCP